MAVDQWQPGTLYPTGSLVVPRTVPPSTPVPITNAGFEDGTTDWTLGPGASVVSGYGFTGNHCLQFTGTGGITDTVHAKVPCRPGVSITARGMHQQGAASAGHNGGAVGLVWYDGDENEISRQFGTPHTSGSGGAWHAATFTGTAPAGAEFVAIAWRENRTNSSESWADDLSWNYVSSFDSRMMYRAVQPLAGLSDANEPVWPLFNGQQVIDNEVIWEAVLTTRIVWEAQPILVSGPTEPDWPAGDGSFVADNTISWEAVSRRVEDPNCPNSREVVIEASKVYAADEDIVSYSATVNPLDWTARDDAGYLPTNTNQYGGNPVRCLGLYRGNVVPANAAGLQVWQVDEDPSQSAKLDAFPIPSEFHHAAAPVGNDLILLTPLGFRTVGIAGGATNMQVDDDPGMVIDPLVQPYIRAAEEDGRDPLGLYVPGLGQYWCFFGDEAFVYTRNRAGGKGTWSRYTFPWVVDDWTVRGAHLYLRHGDQVSRVDVTRETDEIDGEEGIERQPFEWFVQWPWLDFGALGVTKQLDGFDIVGTGTTRIQYGYDQSNGGLWTPEWEITADSVPGQILPMPLAAPSLAIRVTFTSSDEAPTSLDALTLHFQDFRPTS